MEINKFCLNFIGVFGGVVIWWVGEFLCMMVGFIVGCFCFGVVVFVENLIIVVFLIGVGVGRIFFFFFYNNK